jgi:hypothetical protein
VAEVWNVRGRRIAGTGVLAVLVAVAACVAVAVPAYATWTNAATKSVTVTAGHAGSVTATCPAGERAAAGGLSAALKLPLYSHEAVLPQAMYMNGAQTGWSVVGSNSGLASGTLTARVYCDKHDLRSVVVKKVTAPAGHKTTSVATCPAGKVVLGAGFSTPASPRGTYMPPNSIVTHLRATATKVIVAVIALYATTTVSAMAYCGAGPAATEIAAAVNINAAAGERAVAATCPSGKHLLFGGVDGAFSYPLAKGTPQVVPFGMSSPSTTKWQVGGYNGVATAAPLTAYAYCR